MWKLAKKMGLAALVLGICVSPVRGVDLLPVDGSPSIEPAIQALEYADRYVQPGDTVRICTYNIQDFFDGVEDSRRTWDNAERQARVAGRIIDKINPDILVLQEFESPEMVRLLNRVLDRPYAVGYVTSFGSGVGRHNKLNLAVLSRFPVRDATELDFSAMRGQGRPTRGLLRFEVDLDDDLSLLVYNVHLKANWGDQRRNISQRQHALRLLKEDLSAQVQARGDDRTWHVMVAGDFNVDPEHPSFAGDPSLAPFNDLLDLWAGRPLEERITVPTRYGVPDLVFPPVAFDRFYLTPGLLDAGWIVGQPDVVSKGVNIDDVRVIAGEDDVTASDHYPVFIDLHRSRL